MKLNLGCGYRKIDSCINVDNREAVKPDIVVDVEQGLPFLDDSIDEVMAIDFLEHIPIGKTVFVVEEIHRVLKGGGTFIHMTPSTDGRGAFQDPYHQSFWNANSWKYYMDDSYRDLYNIKAKFSGSIQDVVTDRELKVIHTRGILTAVK